MKSFKLFLVLALVMGVSLIAFVSPAFALQCKDGNNGSDECWTNVKVSSGETNVVNKGTILIYDFTSSASADTSAYQVRVATATTDSYLVAGVAQRTIATGDSGMILVRGQGKIKTWGAVTSGDRLYVTGSGGRKGTAVSGVSVDVASVASHDKAIAIALETSTTDATADAFIVVI